MFRMNLTCWFDQRLWIWRHGIHYRLIGKVNPLTLLHFSKVSFEKRKKKSFWIKYFEKAIGYDHLRIYPRTAIARDYFYTICEQWLIVSVSDSKTILYKFNLIDK